MRIKILAASFTILLAHTIASAARAPAPAPMTPTGPWNVEFADKMCVLSRQFGKDGATNLLLKPGIVGEELEIIVSTPTTTIGATRNGKATLTSPGKIASEDGNFIAYNTSTLRLLRIRHSGKKLPLSVISETLTIDTKEEGRHAFSVPGIERALPVLSKCVAELRTIYKISDADLAAIATQPKDKPGLIFSFNDYPREALDKKQSGTVGILVWVEASGRVSTCEIIELSAPPVLGSTTCDLIKRRGRFIPAKDADGKAIRAPVFTRVSWQLPS